MRQTRYNWQQAAAFITEFTTLGIIILISVHGATIPAAFEAEAGQLTEPATQVSDSSASGNGAIKFGGVINFVSPTGSDTAAGTAAAPWLTVQHAVDTATSGTTIELLSGIYAPFTITHPNLTVTTANGAVVTIAGKTGMQNVVAVKANNTTLSNMTVSGCVPNPTPPGSFETQGSAQVRIDGATGVNVSHLVIQNSDKDSSGNDYLNKDQLPFGCYGLLVYNSGHVTVANNDINHNGAGVYVDGGTGNIQINDNQIHDNDVIIRNTITNNDDDFGAAAITVAYTSASPGVTADSNTLYSNIGPSHDYGTDGGATEIYQASNVTFSNNTMRDNDDIFESGTGSTDRVCDNNKFINNTAQGKVMGSTLTGRFPGMILRCAENMQITGNTFTNINWYVIDISSSGQFAGSLDGLNISSNTFSQSVQPGKSTSEKTYSLDVNPTGLGITINNNHYHYIGFFASNWDNTGNNTLTQWQTKTGFDANSTTF